MDAEQHDESLQHSAHVAASGDVEHKAEISAPSKSQSQREYLRKLQEERERRERQEASGDNPHAAADAKLREVRAKLAASQKQTQAAERLTADMAAESQNARFRLARSQATVKDAVAEKHSQMQSQLQESRVQLEALLQTASAAPPPLPEASSAHLPEAKEVYRRRAQQAAAAEAADREKC
eukprot:gnl/TRDRNA2_/TRDRNA2_189658_c0_seq1.p1 gnl/TRDRNA2_/TRDRNA2_189658_c0~~gnl/TRDRNA2_/TRDRNA2_189658_c0_seq1.p1  ORF type:complete len:181 (-),score=41.17 gnl/TRDRNA2_/TRDRNA2_189658_c0_seq1:90-632(-)